MTSELEMSATEWLREQIAKEFKDKLDRYELDMANYEKDRHDSVIILYREGVSADIISKSQKMELSEVQKILKEAGLMA